VALSYWQIAALAAYLLIHVIPIFAADRFALMPRQAYALRTIGLLALAIALAWLLLPLGQAGTVAAVVACFAILFLFVLWSVHRLQDCAWPRWLCLLLAIPLVGLVFWLVLLAKPSALGPGDIEIRAIFD